MALAAALGVVVGMICCLLVVLLADPQLRRLLDDATRLGTLLRWPAAAKMPPPTPSVPTPTSPGPPAKSARKSSAVAGGGGVHLQVAAFSSLERSQALTDKLQQKGYRVQALSSGDYQRVVVGPYHSDADLARARQALAELGFGSSIEVHLSGPQRRP